MLDELIKVLKRLRKECPWDRKQTLASVRPLITSEAFELDAAIREKNSQKIAEELGDLLFLILFVTRLLEEKKKANLPRIIKQVKNKLILRHPHVFKKVKVKDVHEVLSNWERIKQKEKKDSILAGVPKSLPALHKAQLVQERVKRVGFDWPNHKGVLEKIEEELTELKAEIKKQQKRKAQEEFGDLLFAIVNLTRHLDVDAEAALNQSTDKFIKRFKKLEKNFTKNKKDLTKSSLAEMDKVWEEVK
ncbi:MAG: nucleoside triphosphate pyrophosphohydrolase [candidate division WOR-3 bacterium]|nr:nucleoside triphosphate pyrophosphohydrolase [candidate division WOR-3 bacterium]